MPKPSASLGCTLVASFLSAAGCAGVPYFEALITAEDSGTRDTSPHDADLPIADSLPDTLRDGSSDEGTDHQKEDVVAGDTSPPGDVAIDSRGVADSWVADSPVDVAHSSEAGADADARNDARADRALDSTALDITVRDTAVNDTTVIDTTVRDTAGSQIGDARTDIGADGITDASPTPDGFVCGFAPPAPGGPCPAVCNDGCTNGICRIGCRDKACKGSWLQCPVGFACEISCIGKQSCDSALLICPATHACSLVCADAQSCRALQLNCRSGTCGIECLGTDQACDRTVVNCGPQTCAASCSSNKSRPTLNCGQSCDCRPCP